MSSRYRLFQILPCIVEAYTVKVMLLVKGLIISAVLLPLAGLGALVVAEGAEVAGDFLDGWGRRGGCMDRDYRSDGWGCRGSEGGCYGQEGDSSYCSGDPDDCPYRETCERPCSEVAGSPCYVSE